MLKGGGARGGEGGGDGGVRTFVHEHAYGYRHLIGSEELAALSAL